MVIDPQQESDLIDAMNHLRQAKSLVDQVSQEIGEGGGKGERQTQKTLTAMATRISSARRELEKLVTRRWDWAVDDPFRSKRRRRATDDEPPIPPTPPEDAS